MSDEPKGKKGSGRKTKVFFRNPVVDQFLEPLIRDGWKILGAMASGIAWIVQTLFSPRLMLFGTCLLVSATLVYIVRKYAGIQSSD